MHERKRFVTAITLLLPVLLVSLGGCASKRLTFVKAGAEQADLEHDKNECLRSAIGTRYRGAEILASYCIDRDVFLQCMQTRGYAVQSD